ncbi:MAG TPA: serine hydrolase [Candidatus Nanoarchaeia archaeon]|nr:serine hydrolase [Candidatus Nanoarchaeia archaeon]
MIISIKRVAVIEAVLIILLLGFIMHSFIQDKNADEQKQNGLLSQKVYIGILEPKNMMIVNFKPLKTNIQNYIKENKISASVYVENLRNGAFMGIGEKTGFFPASLNKLPVAILVMKKIEEGDFTLDTKLEIKDEDRTDSSGTLYKTAEKEISIRILLEKLLKDSDNTALRAFLRNLDLEDLQFILDYYGIDISVENQKNENLITPKAISNMFLSLYFSTILEPDNSEYLLSLMTDTVFDIKTVAGLPDDIKVSHKFGENYYEENKFFHDCGIMYIQESRIFYCIMTKGLDEGQSVESIGAITNEIYRYVIETKANIDDYKPQQ